MNGKNGCGHCPKKGSATTEAIMFLALHIGKGELLGKASKEAGISRELGRKYKTKYEEILESG